MVPEDALPTIRFAGRAWTVKTSGVPVGPGPNLFSADRVTVDPAGRLRLSIDAGRSGWNCAEVIAKEEPGQREAVNDLDKLDQRSGVAFGYGTYRWRIVSDVHLLDRHAVLGMFLWSDDPSQAHRELDIEFARWGEAAPPDQGLFTVQNLAEPRGFGFPAAPGRSEHTISWTPGRVTFRSRFGRVVHQWTPEGSRIPSPGSAVAPRINLWLFRGHAPSGPQAVTIEDFSYVRLRP